MYKIIFFNFVLINGLQLECGENMFQPRAVQFIVENDGWDFVSDPSSWLSVNALIGGKVH